MKQLASLDIAKFTCALLVVSLHCCPTTKGVFFLESLARNAVPLFYAISAYLFFSKKRDWALCRFLLRLAVLYGFWMFATFLPDYVRLSPDKHFFQWLVTEATKQRANYLWFFPSLAFGIVFSTLAIRTTGEKILHFFSIACFSFFYLVENCSGLFGETVLPTLSRLALSKFYYGRIWIAIPFLSLGVYFAKRKKTPCRHAAIMTLAAFLLLCTERWIVLDVLQAPSGNKAPELWFFSVVFCYFAMETLLQFNRETSHPTRFLRSASIIIYVTHGIFLPHFKCLLDSTSNAILYLVVVTAGIGTTGVILYFEKHKLFKWLSWIH